MSYIPFIIGGNSIILLISIGYWFWTIHKHLNEIQEQMEENDKNIELIIKNLKV